MLLTNKQIINYFFFWPILVFSLGQKVNGQNPNNNFDRGKIIDTVWAKHDRSESYALYLPSSYSKKRHWPVLYVFEPMARASLPLKFFKQAAEKYGYILVCSNNAKNGPWEPILDAADAMFVDTFSRFSIDSERVYTSGFSGGSRAAVSMAVITRKVQGVIGCGAGFSNVSAYRPSAIDNFVYIGLVGNKDMNYSEHLDVARSLDELRIENELLVFEGVHQWPPADELETAIAWLEIQRAKRSNQKPNDLLLDDMKNKVLKAAKQLESDDQILPAIEKYEFGINTLDSFVEVSDLNNRVEGLKNLKTYPRSLKKRQKLFAKEAKLKEKYIKSFAELHITRLDTAAGLKGEAWWHNEIDYLKRLSKGKDKQEHQMAERMINLIWARCAESSFSYLAKRDNEMALILNNLWLYAQPKSVWAYWNLAKVLALSAKHEESISALEKAVEYGLSRVKSLEREPAFQLISNERRYKDLKKKLQSKTVNR